MDDPIIQPVCLPRLSDGERDLAEHFLKVGDAQACASHFKVPLVTVNGLLRRRDILLYINLRRVDIDEGISLTREKVLARLNAVLDSRLDASKNLLRGIEIAAKVLGMIRPDVALAIVSVSPYAQLTEAELEAEIRRRLDSPKQGEVIEVEAEVIRAVAEPKADNDSG